MKLDIRLELQLGIIEGCVKRQLENYIDERLFRQRKTFDEYIIDETNIVINTDLKELLIMAEYVKVRILPDCVMLSSL